MSQAHALALAQAWETWSSDPTFPYAKSKTRGYCINATRTGVDALARFGVKAKPISVGMLIANQAAVQLIDQGIPPKQWPEHAWSIGLGHGNETTPESGWNGHLVIEGTDFMLDLSAETLHRPGLIDIDGPLVLPRLPPVGEAVEWTLRGNLRLVMHRTPEHNGWRQASGWLRRDTEFTNELVRRMRGELAAHDCLAT